MPSHDTNIYNFETLKSIANGLNFQEEIRRSRDGTKQILLHDRNLPNENLRYQIFDLANRVAEYSNLPSNLVREWKYVSEDDDLVPPRGMLNKLKLLVCYVKGDERQEVCSCDSKFMLDTMLEVRQAILEAYRCIGIEDCIRIFLHIS